MPVLSEEAERIPYSERRQWRRYWLVDPLDGTKEFVSRNGEFTVNIALIETHDAGARRRACAGHRHARTRAQRGAGATRQIGREAPRAASARRATAPTPLRIVGSRSHRDAALDRYLPQPRAARARCRRQLDQVLPGRRRQRGFLSALRPDQRMGHGRRAGGRGGGRRPRASRPTASRCATTPRPEVLNPHFLVSGDPNAATG